MNTPASTMNIHQLLLGGLTALMTTASGCNAPDPSSNDRWFTDQRWSHRMLVFTDVDPESMQQSALFADHEEALLDRNLLVIRLGPENTTLLTGSVSDLPDAETFRKRFTLPSEHFEAVLVGKDGRVKERRTEPMNPDELWSIIDAMPMRIDEMRRNEN